MCGELCEGVPGVWGDGAAMAEKGRGLGLGRSSSLFLSSDSEF